jgi:N-dimethylarginine dimethylaminohydrolase
MQNVLMCPPTYYTVRDVKNPHMDPNKAIDSELALSQWNSLRRAFEDAGCTTYAIDPIEGFEDMVYAANQVFVGHVPRHAPFVIPSRMRFPSREREVAYYVEWFRRRGYAVLTLPLGEEFLEGHGDLLWHENRAVVWAGYGFRSTRAGVERFSQLMQTFDVDVRPLELVDPVFYHLDTCLMPLNADAAVIYSGAFSQESLEALRHGWIRLYEMPRDDAMRFVCNGVTVNGRVIGSHVSPALSCALDAEHLTFVNVDLSEFEKGGGSAFCMRTFFGSADARD